MIDGGAGGVDVLFRLLYNPSNKAANPTTANKMAHDELIPLTVPLEVARASLRVFNSPTISESIGSTNPLFPLFSYCAFSSDARRSVS